ncbi:hypothetical protein LJC34_05695 [Oscillospiraceae bacterium OttesenSCG-928-G22]|nr:hypothetical protein [Oscillospiraceae bacterium OttesenSCG-928-G22]
MLTVIVLSLFFFAIVFHFVPLLRAGEKRTAVFSGILMALSLITLFLVSVDIYLPSPFAWYQVLYDKLSELLQINAH